MSGTHQYVRRTFPTALMAAVSMTAIPTDLSASQFSNDTSGVTRSRANIGYARLESDERAASHVLEDAIFIPSTWAPLQRASISALQDYDSYQVANWDGGGARPIAKTTLSAARSLLDSLRLEIPSPEAAPGADGTIGLEWWNGNARLFVDIGPGSEIRTYFNPGDGQSSEEAFQWGDAHLKGHLEKLFKQLYDMPVDAGGTLNLFIGNTSSANLDSEVGTLFPVGMSGFVPLRELIT